MDSACYAKPKCQFTAMHVDRDRSTQGLGASLGCHRPRSHADRLQAPDRTVTSVDPHDRAGPVRFDVDSALEQADASNSSYLIRDITHAVSNTTKRTATMAGPEGRSILTDAYRPLTVARDAEPIAMAQTLPSR